MNDPRRDILDDVKRWVHQQQRAGVDRVPLDEARIAQLRDEVFAKVLAQTEPAAAPTAEPKPATGAPTGAPTAAAPAKPAAASAGDTLEPARVRRDPEILARKSAALAELDAQQVSKCTKCPLHESRTQTVFGVGNPDADLVFVGEAPGRDEDLKGEPFVGRAGQLLTKILGAIGFTRDDVYICNVLKCRPPDNRDPLPDEVAHCEPYLLKQLEILEPKVICALGRISAQTLLKTNTSLTRLRAEVHDYHGIPLVATYHPAALLRNPNWKRPTWEDVQKLRAMYDELTAG